GGRCLHEQPGAGEQAQRREQQADADGDREALLEVVALEQGGVELVAIGGLEVHARLMCGSRPGPCSVLLVLLLVILVIVGVGIVLNELDIVLDVVRSWSRLRGVTPRRSGVTVASRRGAIARSSRVPSRSWASSVAVGAHSSLAVSISR